MECRDGERVEDRRPKTEGRQSQNGKGWGGGCRGSSPVRVSAARINVHVTGNRADTADAGGAKSHLMRCSDGNYYVVKFQNNPQHRRILVNELLGTRLVSRLGLPTVPLEVVEVRPELIRLTPELCIELPRSRMPCMAGLQFGSRYPGDPRKLTLHDFLPDEKLREVANLHDFAGMLVFDNWTCKTSGRQTLFLEKGARKDGKSPEAPRYTSIAQSSCSRRIQALLRTEN
jgi:hypothetical protein